MFEVTSLCGQIYLGKQGENLARLVCFDELKQWKSLFGEGKCELLHQRNGENAPYPVVLEIKDDKICWKITDADTAIAGEGKCELHYSVDGVIVKSKTWVTNVLPSLGEDVAEPPEPQKAWVDQVLSAAEEVKDATTHQPIIGENGNWFVWDFESNSYIDSGTPSSGKLDVDLSDYYTKEEVDTIVNDIGSIAIDQTYNPESENAQSGKAVHMLELDLRDRLDRVQEELNNAIGDIETLLGGI